MKPLKTIVTDYLLPPHEEFSLRQNSDNFLDYIRERGITVLLRLCVLLGAFAVFVGSVAAWQQQNWAALILGTLAYVGVLALAINRQIHYKVRSLVLIIFAYTYIVFSLFNELNEFSFVPLFAFVVMTALLTGRRGGMIAFLLSLATIFWVNWRITMGQITLTQYESSLFAPFSTVLATYTDWIFYGGLFLFTIWIYFDGFTIIWKRENEAMRLLAKERDRLETAVTREQALLEQLTQAHQREIELSRMKSQIITTVSHEFRTPLTVINNSVELLTNYYDKFDAEKRAAIQERINDSVYYLTGLLQDASLVNKAYSQGFQANMVSLPLNGLGQRLNKDLLQESNDPPNVIVQYDANDETAVCLDYDFTFRAIFSFLSNALKYSPPSEPILIKIQLDEQLSIAVTDTGIGIAPDELQQIWELFYRGSNATSKHGLGFGLYLTKRLAQAMDGSVTAVSSGLNQGSTFSIHIPQKNLLTN